MNNIDSCILVNFLSLPGRLASLAELMVCCVDDGDVDEEDITLGRTLSGHSILSLFTMSLVSGTEGLQGSRAQSQKNVKTTSTSLEHVGHTYSHLTVPG